VKPVAQVWDVVGLSCGAAGFKPLGYPFATSMLRTSQLKLAQGTSAWRIRTAISGPMTGVLNLAEIPQDAAGAFRYLLLR
jgi:hypothetical protein